MISLPDGRQLYHTPLPDTPAEALQALTDFWESATKSVFIVDYSFNLPLFETMVPALLEKGIQVTLVLDRSQSKGTTEVPLITALRALETKYPTLFTMVIGTSSMHQIIHDKFTVVDGVDAEYGSFNYTSAAGKEDNFFFIERNSSVASDLLEIGNGIKDWIVTNEPQPA